MVKIVRTRTLRRGALYWEQQGWALRDGCLFGAYRAGGDQFEGKVDVARWDFLVRLPDPPPAALRAYLKWPCFIHSVDHWWIVHLVRKPQSVDAGIQYLEYLIADAYRQYETRQQPPATGYVPYASDFDWGDDHEDDGDEEESEYYDDDNEWEDDE